MIVQSRAGDNFATILTRLNMPAGERSLWERSIRRDIGNRPMPVGKQIHFYFTKSHFAWRENGNRAAKSYRSRRH